MQKEQMEPIFRVLQESDNSDVVELMVQLGYEHSESSLKKNIDALRGRGGEIFVAELSGKVCGCISAILDVRLAEGVQGELVSLVVKESYRGKGIGKGLVVTAESWLANDTLVIRVRANELREQAHQFYKGLGYSICKKQVVFSKNA